MSGHVFHPGHHALHGITVVLETNGSLTHIGRFDTEDQGGIHLLNVASHDASAAEVSKDEFVRKSARFGVAAQRPHLVVPAGEVVRITPLGELAL